MVYITNHTFDFCSLGNNVTASIELEFDSQTSAVICHCSSEESIKRAIMYALRDDIYRKMVEQAHRIGTITDWGYRPSQAKPKIERVIFHDPATIVYWKDGTKTVVKCQNEKFDKEKGLLAAIAKKAYGNKGNFNNIIKHFVEE